MRWRFSGSGSAVIAIVATMAVVHPSLAQCEYESEVYFTGNDESKVVRVISDDGLIGGDWLDFLSSTVFVANSLTFLSFQIPSGFDQACLEDMTDQAFLVGAVWSSQGGAGRACIWQNGIPIVLEPFEGANNSWATGCNSSGAVVGVSSDVDGGDVWEGFLWTSNSGMQGLNSILGTQFSDAIDISETGAIVGSLIFEGKDFSRRDSSPFIYNNGDLQILGPVVDDAYAVPMDIAGDDLVVGYMRQDLDPGWLFIPWQLDGNGEIEILPLPEGALQAKATSVSLHGHVTGEAWYPMNQRRPVLWIDRVPYLADELAPLPSEGSYTERVVISDLGSIAITASIDGVNGPQPAVISPLVVSPADLNLDCTVGVDDLLLLLSEWNSADFIADIDGSGEVGVDDLLLLLADWGMGNG